LVGPLRQSDASTADRPKDPLPNFRPLPDHHLDRLDDDPLIEYVRQARAKGELGEVERAVARLAYGYLATIRRRVSLRIPDERVEEVAWEVIESALRSVFDGSSQGEFRSWMGTIIQRRVADYWKKHGGDPRLVPLASEHEREEGVRGEEPAVEGPDPGVLDLREAIEHALCELERDDHRRVIEEAIFNDRPSAEVAAEIEGMTAANVDQIKSRFRKRVRELLEDDGDTPAER
jgi:DNA-directed RNA polymerase specialized sigma24 family protein